MSTPPSRLLIHNFFALPFIKHPLLFIPLSQHHSPSLPIFPPFTHSFHLSFLRFSSSSLCLLLSTSFLLVIPSFLSSSFPLSRPSLPYLVSPSFSCYLTSLSSFVLLLSFFPTLHIFIHSFPIHIKLHFPHFHPSSPLTSFFPPIFSPLLPQSSHTSSTLIPLPPPFLPPFPLMPSPPSLPARLLSSLLYRPLHHS